jgi:hypothetical protein
MKQDEIIEMALKVDLMGHELAYSDWYKNRLKAFGKLVAEKEREACAKVCEEYETNNDIADTWLNIVSEVIRARGQA